MWNDNRKLDESSFAACDQINKMFDFCGGRLAAEKSLKTKQKKKVIFSAWLSVSVPLLSLDSGKPLPKIPENRAVSKKKRILNQTPRKNKWKTLLPAPRYPLPSRNWRRRGGGGGSVRLPRGGASRPESDQRKRVRRLGEMWPQLVPSSQQVWVSLNSDEVLTNTERDPERHRPEGSGLGQENPSGPAQPQRLFKFNLEWKKKHPADSNESALMKQKLVVSTVLLIH